MKACGPVYITSKRNGNQTGIQTDKWEVGINQRRIADQTGKLPKKGIQVKQGKRRYWSSSKGEETEDGIAGWTSK